VVAAVDDAQSWLDVDLALLRDVDGWRSHVDRPDLQIVSRLLPDDPNLLFRWRLVEVEAPADVVFAGFVERLLDYHAEWTKEYVGGRVVATPTPTVRILHQRFDPGIPGVAPRDLCSADVTRTLPDGVLMASFRSVDAMPAEPGHTRIDWWGAVLCTPIDDRTSELAYLDRENQGGRFPAWLMNRMMTRYLVTQAEAVRIFFAAGGPPELRRTS
jgi:hypothetical protein